MVKKVEDYSELSERVEDWYNGRVMDEVKKVENSDSELIWNSKELLLEGTFVNYEEVYKAYKEVKIIYKKEIMEKIVYLDSLESKKEDVENLLRESPVVSEGIEQSEGLIVDSFLDIMEDVKEEVLYELNMEIKQVMYHNLSDEDMDIANRDYCGVKRIKYNSEYFGAESH